MLESNQTAKNRIAALLGGRAAEQVILGEALNGAGIGQNSDLELATQLAGQLLFEWGFNDQLVFMPLDTRTMPPTMAEKLVNPLQDSQARALKVISEEKHLVLTIAQTLLEERDLSAGRLEALLRQSRLASHDDWYIETNDDTECT